MWMDKSLRKYRLQSGPLPVQDIDFCTLAARRCEGHCVRLGRVKDFGLLQM